MAGRSRIWGGATSWNYR